MKPRYGVLLISGNQTHQENYAAAFAADARCRLIAVTDEPNIDRRRRELNERLAKSLGIPYVADLAKALADKQVNVVSVCAPPERRGRIAVACARAGKHLYLDKSLVPRLRALNPFDPLLRDRARLARLFGFDYRIEVFVPAPRRKYGYYVFPLLERHRLIGRLDMKADRSAGALEVSALWLEPGVHLTHSRMRLLESELDRIRRFAGLDAVRFADGYLKRDG